MWLMGTAEPFKVFSDHSNVIYFKTAKYLMKKQARWECFLDAFNMEIHHISGFKNLEDGKSIKDDFGQNCVPIGEAHLITNRFMVDEVTNEVQHLNHGFFFQKPKAELL